MANIRRATSADASAVQRLAELAYSPYLERMAGVRPFPMDIDYQAAVLTAEAWVAESGAEVVGFLFLVSETDGMLLENVAVLPSHHGRGVGRALLGLAEERAAAAGHSRIRLYTHETMVENQRLYERIGYVENGRGGGPGRRRVFYEKTLASATGPSAPSPPG